MGLRVYATYLAVEKVLAILIKKCTKQTYLMQYILETGKKYISERGTYIFCVRTDTNHFLFYEFTRQRYTVLELLILK